MHRDMFKIQDGVAIVEKLNCSNNLEPAVRIQLHMIRLLSTLIIEAITMIVISPCFSYIKHGIIIFSFSVQLCDSNIVFEKWKEI